MTYVSSTPEDAFKDLEYYAIVDQVVAFKDDQSFCSALRRDNQHFMVLEEILEAGMEAVSSDDAYDALLLSRMINHVNGCHSCSVLLMDYMVETTYIRHTLTRHTS